MFLRIFFVFLRKIKNVNIYKKERDVKKLTKPFYPTDVNAS